MVRAEAEAHTDDQYNHHFTTKSVRWPFPSILKAEFLIGQHTVQYMD